MNIQAENIKENDLVNGMLVTKLTAKFVVCGDKRISKSILNKEGFKFTAKLSPDTKVDWTDKQAVIDYYDSFVDWNFYIAQGDKYETQLCEVKDGLALFNGEYYLPAPSPNNGNWNAKDTKKIADGTYYINLYKRINNWFGVKKEEACKEINVFYISCGIAKDENYIPELSELYIRPFDRRDCGICLDYSSSHRSGLSIDIRLEDLFHFVSTQFYGNAEKKQIAFFTQEFKNHFVQGFDTNSDVYKLKNEIGEILDFSESKYYVSDDESYGDYTLYNVQLNKGCIAQINELVKEHIKKFKGIKYLKTLSEINS